MYYKINVHENFSPTLGDIERMGIPIFDDSWETYIPEHKPELEKKILNAYRFNQIGCDTPDRFIYYLNAQLAQIMPYYNQLYMSELIKFNPLLNHSIQASGRNIENILTKANTKDDKFAKAIRDFVGDINRAGNAKTNNNENTVTSATENMTDNKVYAENTTYEKEGKGSEIHTAETNTQETMNQTDTFSEGVKTDNTNTVTNNLKSVTDNDKTVTETPSDTTTKKTDWGGVVTTKTDKDETTTTKGDGSKHSKEVTDDDSTTKTITNLTENGSSNREQDYADTPQVSLDTDSIRKDYLTNVTWNDEKNTHKADTTVGTTYTDDVTKNTDETYHDTGSGTKKNDDTETATKSGSDTETTTRGGNIETVTEDDTTVTSTGTVSTVDDGTKKTNSTAKKNGEVNTTEGVSSNTDKPWDESGKSDTDTSSNEERKTTADTTAYKTANSTTDKLENEQTRETANTAQSSVNNVEKTTEETTDTGSSNFTQGFMNVSPSALLEAFRRTFLNIDAMIIEELRTNFMLVF